MGSCPATPQAPYFTRSRSHSPMMTVRREFEYDVIGCLSSSGDQNDGRFHREFSSIEKIGEGHFSNVFKAKHNVDDCVYAVKRSKPAPKQDKKAAQEAYVMASLSAEAEGCPHIVRYFHSWFEGNQLFIQM